MQRARNLRDTQYFGKQDPYVLCYLLPEQEGAGPAVRPRTHAVMGGGTAPVWSVGDQGGAALRLRLPAVAGVVRVVVEVWNENTVHDNIIGRCDLPLPPADELNRPAATRFHHLDTGGEIALSVALVERGNQ